MSIRSLLEDLKDQGAPSGPGGWYSEAGRCFFCYFEDVPYVSKQMEPGLVFYLADDDERVIGLYLESWRVK